MIDSNIPLAGQQLDIAAPIYRARQQENQDMSQANQNAMATQNILQQHYQNLDMREKSRLTSTIVGAVQLKQFLDSGDLPGAQNFLEQRRQMLHNRVANGENVDTQETDYALEALRSGKLNELQNGINGLIAAGQVYGVIGKSNNPYIEQFQAVKSAHPGWSDAQVQDYVYTRGQVGKGTVFDQSGQVINQPGAVSALAERSGAEKFADVRAKSQAEATGELSAREASLPHLLQVVDQLSELSKKATYSVPKQAADYLLAQTGIGPTKGAIARTQYQSIIDNEILPLLRQTFGAQFTEKEGQSLKSTLGDVNKTPEEKQAVLNSFIQAKVGQIKTLKQQLGSDSSAVPSVGTSGIVVDENYDGSFTTPSGIKYKVIGK